MPGWVRHCTLTLALLLAAPAAGAGSLDCWLLEGHDLDQAREQGLCQDAFSRNSQAGEPPVILAPSAPIPARKPDPPPHKPVRTVSRSAKATTSAQASRVVRPARTAKADADFGTRFRNDWNALMRLFAEGGPSGPGSQPANGGPASTPQHLSRTGR